MNDFYKNIKLIENPDDLLVLVNKKIMGIKPKFLKRVVILLMFIAKEISFFMKKVKMNNKIIFIKLKRDVIKIIECIKLIYDKISI